MRAPPALQRFRGTLRGAFSPQKLLAKLGCTRAGRRKALPRNGCLHPLWCVFPLYEPSPPGGRTKVKHVQEVRISDGASWRLYKPVC